MNNPRTILLAGLGNTGSHLAPLLARMGLADNLVLVDPDFVEEGNMAAQNYCPEDIGKSKVDATARRLLGLHPDLNVERFAAELEDLPLSYFSGTVALCLDQDGARQVAAERTWLVGGLLYDIAVNGQASLARVTRIERDPSRSCLECAWTDQQYKNLPTRNSCHKTAPTNAPAALGGLAASHAALQILSPVSSDANSEIISSPLRGETWVSKLPVNENCRFHHEAPSVECLHRFDSSERLKTLLTRLKSTSLDLPGFTFVDQGRCLGCGGEERALLVNRALHQSCKICGEEMEFPAFHSRQRIDATELSLSDLRISLDEMGLRRGDVVRTDHNRWVQLGEHKPIFHPLPSHTHV